MTMASQQMSEGAVRKLDEARVRLTCMADRFWKMVLTEEERQLLGGRRSAAFPLGVAGMWQRLHGGSEERAVIEAIYAVEMLTAIERKWLIQEIGESMDDAEAAIEHAANTTALVLVERPRQVYWKGKLVDIDWTQAPALWDYFWQLASHSKRGQAIDSMMFGEEANEKHIVHAKNRLKARKSFPADLMKKIGKAGRGTQKLDLPPDQIQLFEIQTTETLRPKPR